MMFIRDLGPCSDFPDLGATLSAVGWLGRGQEFPRGKVPESFFKKLSELCASPWQPFSTGGRHTCDLCQYEPPTFSANLFVPHAGRVYVAPVGIQHYIAAHWYAPPVEFIDAVMSCPAMKSMAYMQSLLANGGRNLARLTKTSL